MRKRNVIDRAICLLVAFMIVSFYLFELESWGRYVILAVAVLVAMLNALNNHMTIRFAVSKPFHRYVGSFALFCFASAAWAWNPSAAISKGMTILLILMCFSLMYPYYRQCGNIDSLIESFFLSGYALCIYSLFYYGFDGIMEMTAEGGRMDNDFTNVNSIGMAASMSCIIQIYYLLRKERKLLAVCMIPAVLMIAATQSRKAIIMLVIGVVLVFIFRGQGNTWKKKVGAFLSGAMVLVFLLYLLTENELFEGVLGRFENLFDSMFSAHDEDIRTIYRRIGWRQFLKTPILGIGMGNSLELLQSMGHRRTYLHCNYVELLSSGGIIGFVIYYSIYLKLGWNLWKYRVYRSATTSLCGILLFLMLVMDYGMTSYYDKQQYLCLMCFFLHIDMIQGDHLRARTIRKAASQKPEESRMGLLDDLYKIR